MNVFKGLISLTIFVGISHFAHAKTDVGTAQLSPADVVDKQLVAYNNQDIDAFAATYHDDVEVYEFPAKLKSKGIEALRNTYQGMFASLKCLNASSLNRIVEGRFVTDHEQMKACEHKAGEVSFTTELTVTYEVVDGLIKRVIFFN